MFFKRKKPEIKCSNCSSVVEKRFDFCPYCGNPIMDLEKEKRDFGMLGKNDALENRTEASSFGLGGLGITDKMISSIMNSLMKNLRQMDENTANIPIEGANIEQIPNGIKIKIGIPNQNMKLAQKPKPQKRKEITEAQLEKMSRLPRAEAKSKIRRLSDKVIYEIAAPGIESTDDVFISKLESGYEIKAIGKKKVYVNTLPITLPLRSFSVDNKKLLVEFKLEK
ncbi:MAG: zinc ribbon domain-containing protein [archaeon]|jgi:hypothetical protein|nr:zinc ribbon domain-containing protein [archaeon]